MALGTPTRLAGAVVTSPSATITDLATGSFSPTGGALVFVCIGTLKIAAPAPSAFTLASDTFTDTLTWTKIDEQEVLNTDPSGTIAIFWTIMPATPGSGTVTVSWTTAAIRNVIDAWEVTGADATTPVLQKAKGQATGTTLAINLATSTPPATSIAAGLIGVRSDATGITPGTDFTEILDVSSGGSGQQIVIQAQYDLAPADTTVDWSDLANESGGIVFEVQAASGDTTPPTLSSPTGTATSDTEADLSVDTDEDNGTLYVVVTTSATSPSVAQVQAGQDHTGAAAAFDDSQAVSTTGTQNFAGATGLTESTTYYAHYQQQDTATNDSTVVTSASFTTDDVTPPTLSSPTGTATSDTEADLSVDVDEAADVYVVVTRSATTPTHDQIAAGTDENDDPADYDEMKAAGGAGTVNFDGATGLAPATEFWAHYAAVDPSSNEATPVTTAGSFTTDASFPEYTITNDNTRRVITADDDQDQLADAFATLIADNAADSMGAWVISGTSTDHDADADDSDLDEFRNLLATLVAEMVAGTFDPGDWTITNALEDRAYDADDTSLDELMDVFATFVSDDPQATGGSVNTPQPPVGGWRAFRTRRWGALDS